MASQSSTYRSIDREETEAKVKFSVVLGAGGWGSRSKLPSPDWHYQILKDFKDPSRMSDAYIGTQAGRANHTDQGVRVGINFRKVGAMMEPKSG